MIARRLLASACLLFGATSCGDTSPATGSMTVQVTTVKGEPVAGAYEAETDAAGFALLPRALTDVDSVIAHKPGWTFSATGGEHLRRALADTGTVPPFVLFERTPSPTATLSGEVTGMSDEGNALVVTALSSNSRHVDLGPSWTLAVAAEAPTTLFAVEAQFRPNVGRTTDRSFIAFAASESFTPEDGQVVALDLVEDAIPTTTVSGGFSMPGDPLLSETCVAFPNVWGAVAGEPFAFLGGAEHVAPTAAGDRFELAGRYALPPSVELVSQIQCISDNGFTQLTLAAPLADGFTELAWPSPPRLTVDPGTAPHPLRDPLTWTIEGSAPLDFVGIRIDDDDGLVGLMRVVPDENEVRIPTLPTASDSLAVLDVALMATIFSCQSDPDSGCPGIAASPSFFVAP